MHDVFGNCVGVASLADRMRELVFERCVRLENTTLPAFHDLEGEIYTGTLPFAYAPQDMSDLLQSMVRQYDDLEGLIDAWARRFVRTMGPTRLQALLLAMTQAIYSDFRYKSRLAVGAHTPLETLSLKIGRCRDFALLMIEAARSLGLASRFVSGYIYCRNVGLTPSRFGGGHAHAWVRIHLPDCGWVEFDPTNGTVGNTDLICVAISRDPRRATPLNGSFMGSAGDYLGTEVEVDARPAFSHAGQRLAASAVGMTG